MIKIILPAANVEEAIAIRDRIKGIILVRGETAQITDGGVAITTANPTRVCLELQGDGFF
jgi:hypothetical protein